MKHLILSALFAVPTLALPQAARPPHPPVGAAARAADTVAILAATADPVTTTRTSAAADSVEMEMFRNGVESPAPVLLNLAVDSVVALVYVGLALVVVLLVGGAVVLATGLVSATALGATLSRRTLAERVETFLWVSTTLGGGMVGAAVGEGVHLWRPQQVGQVVGPAVGAAAGLGAGLLLAWLLVQAARLLLHWWAARPPHQSH